MKRRYFDYMNEIQPSPDLSAKLEREMIRELRRKRSNPIVPITAAAAAALALGFIGIRAVSPAPDVITQPHTATAAPTAIVETTAVPTASPTAAPTESPSVEPASVYPPEEIRLELEMSDEGVFLSPNVANSEFKLFQDYLAGSSTHGASIVEICQGPELNSVVVAPLSPGTAYWPMTGEDDLVAITDKKGKEVGYAQRVQYLDEASNTLKEGWKHTIHAADPLPEVPDNPVEEITLPGRVKVENAAVRYGRSSDAPVIASLEKDQLIAIDSRVGNWLYVSTEPFSMNSEPPVFGWIHISEVVGARWRESFLKVDLLAQEVNLRESPDGKVVATLNKNLPITYCNTTVPGKKSEWHYVYVGGHSKVLPVSGYVSAEYTKLNTFWLESELSFDGVVSATLFYSENTPFGATLQTVDGEKLDLLLERLRNAYSELVYSPVCGEGAASITLTYADGHTVTLPIAGDGCPQIRYGAVTYDLKTDAERTAGFLNDASAGIEDILPPIFDQIKLP